MRFPRPRSTVRRLMIAVAVVALAMGAALWVFEMRARSLSYRRRADDFERMSLHPGSMTRASDGRPVDLYENENSRIEDDWALEMAAKYRRLSLRPWLAVEPDSTPRLVPNPRGPFDLPPRRRPRSESRRSRPPAWTFPWTWPPR